MAEIVRLIRKRDFLSLGVMLGGIAGLVDILCFYLSLGGVHGVPVHLKLLGIKVSFYIGIPALALVILGKRRSLENAHENGLWVRSVLIVRWVVMFYWISQLIMGIVAVVVVAHILRG